MISYFDMSASPSYLRNYVFDGLRDYSSKWKWLVRALACAEALQIRQGITISRDLAYQLLNECTKLQDLELCRRVHKLINCSELDQVTVLKNYSIRLFSSCKDLVEANQSFSKVSKPDLYTWNAIIDAHAKLGGGQVALHLYDKLQQQQQGVKLDIVTVLSTLKACHILGDIKEGNRVHEQIIQMGLESDIVVGNTLVDMYAKCGNLEEARRVFDRLINQDVVSWSIMISGYAQQWESILAVECYNIMQQKHVKPSIATFIGILKACGSLSDRELGRFIHEQIIESRFQYDTSISNTLVDMYNKCGNLVEAHMIFTTLEQPSVVSWSAMISGYAQHGAGWNAITCFENMKHEGIKPDKVAFLNILKACSTMGATQHGRHVHEQMIETGLQSDSIVISALLDMYLKCGNLAEVQRVFVKLPNQNAVSWGVVIAGYVQHNECNFALECFENMELQGIKPNAAVLVNILKACANLGAIERGRYIHVMIVEQGLHDNAFIGSALIDTYVHCGSLEEAHKVFDSLPNQDVVVWGTLIAGYAEYAKGHLALELFTGMQDRGIKVNKIIFLSILKACCSVGSPQQARIIHEQVMESNLQYDTVVGNSLVCMYAKCGCFEEAHIVLENLPNRDAVTWNAMITGYTQDGKNLLALKCFQDMQQDGVVPNNFTFSSVLKACTEVGSIDQGRHVHEQIVKNWIQTDIFVLNALLDMYAKCGCMNDALQIFHKLDHPDASAWQVMIGGYAQLGQAALAVQCFEGMQYCGISFDTVTFSGMLSAFSRSGFVDEAIWFLRVMEECNCIKADMYHVSCMVDLLGNTGHFSSAEQLLKATPEPDFCLWITLLNACQVHCNKDLGKQCFNAIMHIDPSYAPAYVLMSNIYAVSKVKGSAF